MAQENKNNSFKQLDLKPYQPFGFPLLMSLFALALTSLIITAMYEAFF